jgi:ABC-type metal ion transport system substrate-binding protein
MKGNDMEEDVELQLAELARRLAVVERDLAVIKSNYATKADVVELKYSVIIWVISAVILAQVFAAVLK